MNGDDKSGSVIGGHSTRQRSPGIKTTQAPVQSDVTAHQDDKEAAPLHQEQRRSGSISPPKADEFQPLEARLVSTTNDAGSNSKDASVSPRSAVRAARMSTTSQQRPTRWPGEVFSLHGRIANRQHEFLTVQTQLSYERKAIKLQLDSLNESITQIMQLFEQTKQLDSGLDASPWNDAYSRFIADQQSFGQQMQVINRYEERLGKVEYEVARLEPRLLQIIDSTLSEGQQRPPEVTMSSSPMSRQSSASLSPPARQYYEKRGDLRLLQDRLQDYLAEDQESDDDAVGPLTPDIDANKRISQGTQPIRFFNDREREYSVVRQELQDAMEQLTALWNECQMAGLDVGSIEVETQRTLQLLGDVPEEELGALETEVNPSPFSAKGMQRLIQDFRAPPLMEGFANFSRKSERIKEWVGQIPGNAPPADTADEQMSNPDNDHVVPAPSPELESPPVERATDDLAPPADPYLEVQPGGKFDPNCEGGPIRRLYRWALSWRSSESHRSKA